MSCAGARPAAARASTAAANSLVMRFILPPWVVEAEIILTPAPVCPRRCCQNCRQRTIAKNVRGGQPSMARFQKSDHVRVHQPVIGTFDLAQRCGLFSALPRAFVAPSAPT